MVEWRAREDEECEGEEEEGNDDAEEELGILGSFLPS